jgi:hypothetical protein
MPVLSMLSLSRSQIRGGAKIHVGCASTSAVASFVGSGQNVIVEPRSSARQYPRPWSPRCANGRKET